MKIQMVCLANSNKNGGRLLVGILVQDGIPMVDATGPRWIRLAMELKRPYIPAGLVVDIVPRDILEFEATSAQDLRDCRGTVIFDPYSLRFLGIMDESLIANYCISRITNLVDGSGSASEGPLLLKTQACRIEVGEEEPGKRQVDVSLKFEFGGFTHEFKLDDPWLLEVIKVDPEILEQRQDHHIVLQRKIPKGKGEPICSVMAVMF
jgi:hypothetical protein